MLARFPKKDNDPSTQFSLDNVMKPLLFNDGPISTLFYSLLQLIRVIAFGLFTREQ